MLDRWSISIDRDRCGQDVLASQVIRRSLESVAQHKIDRTTEQLLGFAGHFKKLVCGNGCRILQGRQQVDIAMGLLLSPRKRPENSQMAQPVPAAEGRKFGTNVIQKIRIGRCSHKLTLPRKRASRKQQEFHRRQGWSGSIPNASRPTCGTESAVSLRTAGSAGCLRTVAAATAPTGRRHQRQPVKQNTRTLPRGCRHE